MLCDVCHCCCVCRCCCVQSLAADLAANNTRYNPRDLVLVSWRVEALSQVLQLVKALHRVGEDKPTAVVYGDEQCCVYQLPALY